MKLFFKLSREYPWQTVLTLLAISFAGICEGFGISALLPLLNTVFMQNAPSGSSSELDVDGRSD